MKKVFFATQLAIVASFMFFMAAGSVYAVDGNLNKKIGIDKANISINVNGQTDDAKTRAHSVTNSTTTMASLSADTTRFDLWVMNYSTNTTYASATDTSSTTIVANGIIIPGYSASNDDWKINIPCYTGAIYFYNTDQKTNDVRTLELRR
jgi:hypothetical protein